MKNGNVFAEINGDSDRKLFHFEISGDSDGLKLLSKIVKLVARYKINSNFNKPKAVEIKFDVTRFLNKGAVPLTLNRIDLNSKPNQGSYISIFQGIKLKKNRAKGGRSHFLVKIIESRSSQYRLKLSNGVLFIKSPLFKESLKTPKVEIFGDKGGFEYLSKVFLKISNTDQSFHHKICPESFFGDHYHLDAVLAKGSSPTIVFRLENEKSSEQDFYGSKEIKWVLKKREQREVNLNAVIKDLF